MVPPRVPVHVLVITTTGSVPILVDSWSLHEYQYMCSCYHYHWVGTHLGGQLVPPRVPVHVFVTTTTGSVPVLVDSWSLHEYQYMCLLPLPLGRYPSWWTVGPSTSTSTCVCYHYHWVGTRLGGQLVPPRVPVHVFVTTTTGSVPVLVDSWSLHEYQYMCLLSLPLGRYPSWWTVGPSTSTSTCVCYHYHWVGTHLGGQLVPPRVPVHVFVTTTTGSVPVLVDSWSLHEYQYMCLLPLPLGRYPSWWTVGPSTSTSTCVYHYHWVGTHLGGQLVPPRVPVHVFVTTTTGSVPILVDSWSLHEYQYMCLLPLPLGRYPSWWTVGPSTSTSTCVCYHYHWVGTRLGGQLVPPRVPVHVLVTTTTGSVPVLVDSWSLHEYQYMCLLPLPLGRYPSWWTVGPSTSTSTSTCFCYHYHWVGTRLGG